MTVIKMKAYTYIDKGHFELQDKQKPTLQDPKDTIVKVTLASICSSDLHIKHGSVPRAVTGICTLLCVMLKDPKKIILCETSPERKDFINQNYPTVQVVAPEDCLNISQSLERGGADVVIEVAGGQ